MNKIISETIFVATRMGALSVMFFALAGSALAAPMLTPAEATMVTDTSAVLVGRVVNPNGTSSLWFELSEASSFAAPNIAGLQRISYDATFKTKINNLTPGTVYSFRSAAMDGGVTVYSPTLTFRTSSPAGSSATVVTSGSLSSQSGTPLGGGQNSVSTIETQTSTPTQTQTTTIAQEQTKQVVVPSPVDGFTNENKNAAAVIGSGNGIFPTTLIGWILLLISLLAALIISVMIYEASEKRKRALEEKKKKEALLKKEDPETAPEIAPEKE